MIAKRIPARRKNVSSALFGALLPMVAATLLTSGAARAADGSREAATAATHAGMAASAASLAGVRAHLHHTLNCLEGTGGIDFDPTAANPCAGLGSGAIFDTADASRKNELVAAAGMARNTLALADLAKAQAGAKQTADVLARLAK